VKTLIASILCLFASALPVGSNAQSTGRIPHVAYVWLYSSGPSAPFPSAFRARLKELGWIEGRNIVIDIYDAGGDPDKLDAIMKSLVASKVDLIVGSCTPEGKAAAKLTSTIPIVMAATGDPVAAGLAESLSRPGRNVTGVSAMLLELSGKRMALLKSAFPQVSRATVVYNPERRDNIPEVRTMQEVGAKVGVRLDAYQVRSRVELQDVLSTMAGSGTQALLNAGDNLLSSESASMVAFAARQHIPAMYENREYVDQGGLMSYGPNFPQLHRRAAEYVDKILKGAKPADMPFEQPTTFEFIVNLRTAAGAGFVIPQSVLLQADEIIR
jgi:putative tryptophan/tyrosine transport system substrate-binding protein